MSRMRNSLPPDDDEGRRWLPGLPARGFWSAGRGGGGGGVGLLAGRGGGGGGGGGAAVSSTVPLAVVWAGLLLRSSNKTEP